MKKPTGAAADGTAGLHAFSLDQLPADAAAAMGARNRARFGERHAKRAQGEILIVALAATNP